MLGNWIIALGIFRNILYFILLAYMGAEVTVRLVDALIGEESKNTFMNVKRKFCCSCMRGVYAWDNQFRFVTISLCTYTTAFIFVHYLACTLTFDALVGRSKCIQFLTRIVQSMLNTGELIFDPRIVLDLDFFQKFKISHRLVKSF